MKHSFLLNLAVELGYLPQLSYSEKNPEFKGFCYAFSQMWMHAVCIGDTETFRARLALLDEYENKPHELKLDIAKVRDKIKSSKELLPRETQLSEIEAFFDGIIIYQMQPSSIIVDNLLGDEKRQSSGLMQGIIQPSITYSKALEEAGKITPVFLYIDQYTKDELADFLNRFLGKIPESVPLEITTTLHAVAIRAIDDKSFEFMDINQITPEPQVGDAKWLATKIFDAMPFKNAKVLPIRVKALSVSPIEESKKNEILNCFNKDKKITQLTKNHNILNLAILSNSVEVLDRIDKDSELINQTSLQGWTFFHLACATNNIDMVNALISKFSRLEVNVPHSVTLDAVKDVPPILYLVENHHYNIVKQLLKTKVVELTVKACSAIMCELAKSKNDEALEIFAGLMKTRAEVITSTTKAEILEQAILSGNEKAVELLLDAGAGSEPINGRTPLALAIELRSENCNIIEKLIAQNIKLQQEKVLPEYFEAACLRAVVKIQRANDVDKGKVDFSFFEALLPYGALLNLSPSAEIHLNTVFPFFSMDLQKKVIERGVRCYIEMRKNEAEYINPLGLGCSKTDKIAAAEKFILLLTSDQSETLNKDEKAVLLNGRLGHFYKLWEKVSDVDGAGALVRVGPSAPHAGP